MLPTHTAHIGPTSKGLGAVTCCPACVLMVRDTIGYTIYSSSGVLIKEDEQKTIAGSLLSESQMLECGFKKKKSKTRIGMAGPWKGVGVEIRKKEKYFIMLMKKREN